MDSALSRAQALEHSLAEDDCGSVFLFVCFSAWLWTSAVLCDGKLEERATGSITSWISYKITDDTVLPLKS